MKRFIKIFIGLLLIVFGLLLAFLYHLKPAYKGEVRLPGLKAEADVYYDTYGVPHIFAENETDAMKALGYVHAKERLWQMELVSRIAKGRLSEIFGPKLVKVDKFYLSLGIDENSAETVAALDTTLTSYKMAKAYLDGVNAWVDNGTTPVEFHILGLKKRHFSLRDMYNVYGYMAYGFAMGNQTDPLISAIRNKLGDKYILQMDLNVNKHSTLIPNNFTPDSVSYLRDIAATWQAVRAKTPFPSLIGSNSWVLAPKRTKNKKVIFENDPHIGFSQPAVWYEAHIRTPETEIYGYYLTLIPFPLLGHNHRIAYGLTMLENDDLDLYVEKTKASDPDKYLYGDAYKDFQTIQKEIPVKGGDTVHFTIRKSIHGPVMNEVVNQIKTAAPVTMYWVYTHRPNRLNEAVYNMSRATNLEEFAQGPALIHAPGLNVMYGDADGNIAWWASAHLYSRKSGVSSKMLLDGSVPDNFKLEYLDFNKNPKAINPSRGYVFSCNNQPDTLPGTNYVRGYFLSEDRAKRVLENISKWKSADEEMCMKLAVDDRSSTAPGLLPLLLDHIPKDSLDGIERQAWDILSKWDYRSDKESVGATIYSKFQYEYMKQVFADEMGEEIFGEFMHTYLSYRMIAPVIRGKYPIWSDDIRTPDVREDYVQIQNRAFHLTIAQLRKLLGDDPREWKWKKIHTLEHKHPLGEVKLLRKFFNVGPFPSAGNKRVINNQMYDQSKDYYEITGGPSTRRVIDFSDIEHAKGIIPTGQSGNPLSPHYKDQAELYNQGKFRTLLLNKEEIVKNSTLMKLLP